MTVRGRRKSSRDVGKVKGHRGESIKDDQSLGRSFYFDEQLYPKMYHIPITFNTLYFVFASKCPVREFPELM